LWLLLFPTCCKAQVLLNEVYYDATGSDEGYEFIELISIADGPLTLRGYALEFHDGASSGWLRLWSGNANDTIAAGGLFLIGGEQVVPPPDAVAPLGMQNGPDAVRLVLDGVQADLLGYGALEDARFFEGQAAPDVSSGSSLARRADGVDTGDNAIDFAAAEPSPGRFNVSRRDVALRVAARTPQRDARVLPGVETLAFHVVARGVEPIEAGAVSVRLIDSTRSVERVDLSKVVQRALLPGDSSEVEFDLDLCEGYHRVIASAVCLGDDRADNDSALLLRRVGPTPLLVSEVMSHPAPDCPEYVELFNAAEVPYDLRGHWFRDASRGPSLVVSRECSVRPGGFVVLTCDSGSLAACFPAIRGDAIVEVEGLWPSLNHTGSAGEADSIVVLDAALVPVDRVAYPPQPSETRGRSLERVDLFAGDGPHRWVLSAGRGGGSPGERSPNSRLAPDAARGVVVSPNPFDPWRQETLVAVVPSRVDLERVVVTVFDVDGYHVADLGCASALPSTFVWDGKDAAGVSVLPGIYVLACEFYSLTSGSRRVERVVVGCGKRNGPGADR
jgi:hypothetical protein